MKLAILLLTSAAFLTAQTAKATAHAVTITWTASTTAGVSYNVYRTAGTCPGTTFTKINTTPITATTYDDTAVTGGSTYCYYATSYLSGANPPESIPSNKAPATVPTDQPNPPTNLTVNPSTAQLVIGGNQQQFVANKSPVSWSIDPELGRINQSGMYTTPLSINGNNVGVTVIARGGDEVATAQITLRKK